MTYVTPSDLSMLLSAQRISPTEGDLLLQGYVVVAKAGLPPRVVGLHWTIFHVVVQNGVSQGNFHYTGRKIAARTIKES